MKKAETFEPRWFVLLLLALFLLSAAWLRLYHLGFYSLWHDESFTWFFTRFPWSQMLAALRADGVHPPIYYLLEKILSGILGSNEGGLRTFSVAVDLVSILLAIWLGWLCNGPLGGLVSGWFWAFNPFTLWYAQEARPYAFATMLSLAALILFRKMKTNPSRSTMLITVLVLALGLLTHFFFFLVIGALILLALLQIRQSPAHFRNWTVLCLVAMIPLLLWVVWFFMQPKPMFSIGWITVPILADLPLTVWNFLSGYAGLFSLPSTLFGVITGLLLIVGLVAGESAKDNRQLFLAGIILPLFLTWLVSLRRPVYMDRYYIILLPFLIPSLACGGEQALRVITGFRPAFLAWAVVVCILLGSGLFNAWRVHSDIKYAREDWQGLATYLYQESPARSPFWFLHSEMIVPFEYYYREPYRLLAVGSPPACTEPCWWIYRQPYTPTHAFTQSITIAERPWKPELPPLCQLLKRWDSPTGIVALKIVCR